MQTISTVKEIQSLADEIRRSGKRIGVVPTMGYLHEGHLSLIRVARQHADTVITTIFVNPTQFAPTEDFTKYPRDIERDTKLAASVGTDILFTPSTEEMYPSDYQTFVEVERLTKMLEGKSRPTHFRGVTTIVAKLFNCVKPHVAVFGQKDAQQARVVQQMTKDLNFDVEIVVAPIVREPDGLAMSSRNVYLSPTERREATVLYQSLQLAKQIIERGRRLDSSSERSVSTIIGAMTKLISQKPSARIDYISIADATTLQELSTIKDGGSVLVSLAVRIGSTRLIDNIIISIL